MGRPEVFELTLKGSGTDYGGDGAGKCFYSGQTIDGKVELETSKPIIYISSLNVKLEGKGVVKWKEKEGKRKIVRKKSEIYIDKNVVLKRWGAGRIDEGKYEFKFSFILPKDIPCSFESRYGFVRYEVQATLEGSGNIFNSDLQKLMFITINNPINLNKIPGSKEPISVTESEIVGTLWFKSGPVTATTKIPFIGYTSGQYIQLTADVVNNSRKRMTGAEAKLYSVSFIKLIAMKRLKKQ